MADVAIRAVGIPLGSKSGNITPVIPGGTQVGDLMVAFAYCRNGAITLSCSAGWDERHDSGSNGTWGIYTRTYQTADGNPTITPSTSYQIEAVIISFYNCNTSDPLDVSITAADFAAPSTPFDVTITGFDTVTNGAMAVFCWGSQDDNLFVKRSGDHAQQVSADYDTAMTFAIGTLLKSSAGATGDQVEYESTKGGDAGRSLKFAIKPAGISAITIGATGSPVAQTGKVTEELSASVAAQTAIGASSPIQSAKLTEVLGAEVMAPVVEPLTVATPEQVAKLTEELAVSVAVQPALEAATSQSAKATEEIAASVQTAATLSIDKTDTVKATEETSAFLFGDLSVTAAQSGRFIDYVTPPLTQSFRVSEVVTAEIQEAVIEYLEVSGPVETAKATEEWAVSAAAPVTLEPNVTATVRLTEVEATIVEGLLPDLNITGVTETVKATEATVVSVIAQLARELAAIDSVAVVEEVGAVLSAVLTLEPETLETASVSEVIAASVESGEEEAVTRYLYPNGIILSRCLRIELFHLKK